MECVRQSTDASAVVIDGQAVCEPHEPGQCKNCVGQVDDASEAPVVDRCNQTSPGTKGKTNTIKFNSSVPDCIVPDVREPAESSPTSPGTPESIASTMSLGSKIDAFLKSQRSFSDELSQSSPYSIDSLDEINQVIVDPEEGLVINVDALEHDAQEMKPDDARMVTLSSKKSQSLITEFFSRALHKIQTGSAADYTAYVASCADPVPSNEKRGNSDTQV